MIEAAGIAPGDRVLEIGAGSGYAAAVLGRIAGEVIAIERHAELAELAAARMAAAGLWQCPDRRTATARPAGRRRRPIDAILAAASGSHVPERAEAAAGGRRTLVMPVGEPGAVQQLVRVSRERRGDLEQEDLGAVRFVPLIGAQGWDAGGRSRCIDHDGFAFARTPDYG